MPLYEYQCRQCGQCFEELVLPGLGADEAPACPACGSRETERQLSAFSSPASGSGSSLGGGMPSGPSCGSGGFT